MQSEPHRLDIRLVPVLPQLTPATDLGAVGVAVGHATREELDGATFVDGFSLAVGADAACGRQRAAGRVIRVFTWQLQQTNAKRCVPW
jgi:hypothetical protein